MRRRTLCGKCPYSEFFWSVFSRTVRMRENTTRKALNTETFHAVGLSGNFSVVFYVFDVVQSSEYSPILTQTKKSENFLKSERLRSYQKVKMMKFEGGWDKLWGKKCFYRQRSTYKIVSLLPKSYFWREDWQLGCTAPSFDTFKNIFLIS